MGREWSDVMPQVSVIPLVSFTKLSLLVQLSGIRVLKHQNNFGNY